MPVGRKLWMLYHAHMFQIFVDIDLWGIILFCCEYLMVKPIEIENIPIASVTRPDSVK